jgi:hypothetical protein
VQHVAPATADEQVVAAKVEEGVPPALAPEDVGLIASDQMVAVGGADQASML